MGKKKKFDRNWLKFCMIVYDTILRIHAKNCSENSLKRSFYGTAWSRCAHFCHHGLILALARQGLGGEKKKSCSELAQILHDSLWHYSKHPCKKLLGKLFQTKFLWHGLVEMCTFLPPWADFWPWWAKKKKNSQNCLKFCMVVCGLIVSILAKNRGQIL